MEERAYGSFGGVFILRLLEAEVEERTYGSFGGVFILRLRHGGEGLRIFGGVFILRLLEAEVEERTYGSFGAFSFPLHVRVEERVGVRRSGCLRPERSP